MSLLYLCDQCGASEESREADWQELGALHFCSWKCLAQYATEEAE